MNENILQSYCFLFFEKDDHFFVVDVFHDGRSDDDDRHHGHQHKGNPLAWGSSPDEVFFINIVVALNHFEHITPSVSQIFEFLPLDVTLEGIFEKNAVVELHIEIDGTLSKVAKAEGNDGGMSCKGWVVFVLGVGGANVLVDLLSFDYMEIICRCFTFYCYLIAAILLHGLVEALNLVFGEVVVEPDRRWRPNQPEH
jgi:hypothetical protein